jgi:hypothetical protein
MFLRGPVVDAVAGWAASRTLAFAASPQAPGVLTLPPEGRTICGCGRWFCAAGLVFDGHDSPVRLPFIVEFVLLPAHLVFIAMASRMCGRLSLHPGAFSWRTTMLLGLRTLPLAAACVVLPFFAAMYWHALAFSEPPTAASGRLQRLIEARDLTLHAPFWGALIAYSFGSIAIIRRSLDTDRCRTPATPRQVLDRCVGCGYQASAERPCPECGLENPLALRRVYFGRWHARLMLSRWRWVAALPWVAVVVLFFWPLISGLARHWLG